MGISSPRTSLSRFVVLRVAFGAVALAGLTSSSSAFGQGYGTIKGRLVYGGEGIPTPKVLVAKEDPAAKDSAVCAVNEITEKDLVVDAKTKGVSYGFAYLVKPNGKNAEMEAKLIAKKPKVEIDQKGCQYTPYALAFHKDQTLVFKSSDDVSHNVHYFAFTNGDANQMVAAKGEIKKNFPMAERRPCKLVCDIHPWMRSYFMVFDHPFFAVTGADGSFEITGVPAGTQTIVVWQESVGYVTPGLAKGVAVEVKAGETTDMGEVKLVPKTK